MAKKAYDEMEIFDAIVDFRVKKGYTPTIRELQNIIGIKSSSTVYKYLKILEDLKLISMTTGKVRTIIICEDINHSSDDFLRELKILCTRHKYDIWVEKDKIELIKSTTVRSN